MEADRGEPVGESPRGAAGAPEKTECGSMVLTDGAMFLDDEGGEEGGSELRSGAIEATEVYNRLPTGRCLGARELCWLHGQGRRVGGHPAPREATISGPTVSSR